MTGWAPHSPSILLSETVSARSRSLNILTMAWNSEKPLTVHIASVLIACHLAARMFTTVSSSLGINAQSSRLARVASLSPVCLVLSLISTVISFSGRGQADRHSSTAAAPGLPIAETKTWCP